VYSPRDRLEDDIQQPCQYHVIGDRMFI